MLATPELLVNQDTDALIVEQAREDWRLAQTYFDWVSDPALIDFAIFWERAARLRYIYLLRCLKKEGYALTPLDVIRAAVR